jgi:murein DD-endopeptidase MepM/ murein hydrolase activator NlpD
MKFRTPTGKYIRADRGGDGRYGAPRSKIKNGETYRYTHNGVDLICDPGQEIMAPFDGMMTRIARPYVATEYSGCVFRGDEATIRMFYFTPKEDLIGKKVKRGDVIGIAQDISKLYEGQGVTPHIHLEVEKCDPMLLMETGHA